MNEANIKISKFLSYILRHNPQRFYIELDSEGYADLKDILKVLKKRFPECEISRQRLEELIIKSNKKRFEIRNDEIRAYYGHSLNNKIKFNEALNIPPVLYHGTTNSAWEIIQREGLKSQGRQYVHLSKDIHAARLVGKRRTKNPIVLTIDTQKAKELGVTFYKSWDMFLTNFIPPESFYKFKNNNDVKK